MEQTLFQKKINYLFEQLDMKGKEKEFVSWFSEKGHSYSARKKVVIDTWLYGKMKKNPYWKYEKYPISKEKINGSLVFEESCFKDGESLETFKERVDNYVLNKVYYSSKKDEFEYRYIYYFDVNNEKVSYFELKTLKKRNDNDYIIELIPSEFYKNRGVQSYKGTLKIDKDYCHISVTNNFEILTFYFMLSRGYTHNDKVHGIGLGLSYDFGLPLSTKDLLTKEKLSHEEKLDFYLNANESEYLISDDNYDNLYTDKKTNYLKKFQYKLNNLAIFTTKSREILKDIIKDDAYLNIFHKSFISLNEISKHISLNNKYFVSRRRLATKTFLKSMAKRENTVCYIVYPLFKKDSILFDKYDTRAKESLNLNIKLSNDGLKIERIFVIDKHYKMTEAIKESIKNLKKSGISVYMALKEDIEKLDIISYDFMYSREKDIAVYRNIPDRICFFQVTISKDEIKNLSYDFEKIKQKSIEFDEFLEKENSINDRVLEYLVGTWHWYFYSSIETDKKVEIWDFIVKIKPNKKVYIYNEKYNDLTLEGIIDTTFTENQSFIKAYAKKSKNLSLLFIENRDIDRYVFKVALLDKQRGVHRNMASFTIFSRVKLSESEIIEALGRDVEKTRFMEEDGFDKRINDLDMKARKKKNNISSIL